MVENSDRLILNSLVDTNTDLYRGHKDADKIEKLEEKLRSLLSEQQSLNPGQLTALLGEAAMFDRLANFAEQLASRMETNRQEELAKKKEEELKHILMEQIGIPAEFVSQLSILVKAGAEALKEAAGVYREHAVKIREEAEFSRLNIERIDKQIKALNHIKETVVNKSSNRATAMNEYLAQVRYQESLRDKADLVFKEALEQMENQGDPSRN
jgi:uncharacterized tellurite resistance protein B-like protein